MNVMTGVPIEINELVADAGLPRWEPGEGYELSKCSSPFCGRQMWLGPRQLIELDLEPNSYVLLCMPCSVPILKATGGSVISLGG